MTRTDIRLTWLVARRELVDQMRDWRILMPMLILILFFPYLMNFAAFRSVAFVNQYGGDLIAERIVPFFLMVVGFFPVTVSLIVALEAFVGEKERGTIEPMLSSPLADWHIYSGKLLAGTLVPLGASYLSMGLYLIGLILQDMPFPPLDVLIQMLLLTAVQAVLMVSAAIVISTQSTSVRAANLLASFIVIPVGLLIQAESAMIFWGTNEILWLAIVGVMVITGLIVRLGLAHFQREALIGREIDVLNLRWMAGSFWHAFSGTQRPPALLSWLISRITRKEQNITPGGALMDDLRGVSAWYTGQVFPLLKRMRVAIGLTTLMGLLAVVLSYIYVRTQFAEVVISDEMMKAAETEIRNVLLDGNSQQLLNLSATHLFLNNVRAELVILLLGVFSFSVGGILIYGINFALIGIVMAAVDLLGISSLGIFSAGVLPHGIFELPSLILVSAAVLYMGVRLVTPNPSESIGQVFIHTLADWFKIAIGLSFPLLLIAALIEAHITPILLYNFFQQVFLAGS